MAIGQQEMTALKQDLEHMRITSVEKSDLEKVQDTNQMQEIQLALADLEAKENQLKDSIGEAKSWSQVVSGSSNKQNKSLRIKSKCK